jgi:hypothetical protein
MLLMIRKRTAAPMIAKLRINIIVAVTPGFLYLFLTWLLYTAFEIKNEHKPTTTQIKKSMPIYNQLIMFKRYRFWNFTVR